MIIGCCNTITFPFNLLLYAWESFKILKRLRFRLCLVPYILYSTELWNEFSYKDIYILAREIRGANLDLCDEKMSRVDFQIDVFNLILEIGKYTSEARNNIRM